MKLTTKFSLSILLVTLLAGSAYAATTAQGDLISPTEEVSDDAYFSGSGIAMNVPVRGEFFAAGDTVTITSSLARSAFVVAGKVKVSGDVAYNAYIAASEVVLEGEIRNDLYIAASTVTITESARILGNLSIVAGNVTIAGKVDGDVRASATTFSSTAEVAGNMNVTTNQLTFTGGEVAGSLTYTSRQELIGKDLVSIGGTVEREVPKERAYGSYIFVNFLSLLLFGCFVLIFIAKQARSVIRTVYNDGWAKNYGAGLLALFGLPILSVLFFATVLGWRVGLLLLAAYSVVLLLAGTFGAVFLGKLVMSRIPSLAKLSQRKHADLFAALAIGLLIPMLISLIPYVGVGVATLGSFIFLVVPVVGASVRLVTASQSHTI